MNWFKKSLLLIGLVCVRLSDLNLPQALSMLAELYERTEPNDLC